MSLDTKALRAEWATEIEMAKAAVQLVLLAPVTAVILIASLAVVGLSGLLAGGVLLYTLGELAHAGFDQAFGLFRQGPWGWVGGTALFALYGCGFLVPYLWWNWDEIKPTVSQPPPAPPPQPEAAPAPPPAPPAVSDVRPSPRTVATAAVKGAVKSFLTAKLTRRPVSAGEVFGAAVRSAVASARAKAV